MGSKKVGRSAKSGKFVKDTTVKKNPNTTVTQTVPAKGGKKKSK